MTKKKPPQPTDRELAILRVLWEKGPSNVGEVQDALSQQRPTGYTTALKMLQIMHTKGLVVRDEKRRPHIYAPAQPEKETQQQLVGDLVQRAFGGSASKLVMQALSSEKSSPQELEEIKQLLKDMEG